MTETNPLTVNQLTKYIRRKFQADPYIYQSDFWLVGELTDYRPSSRHQYFSLKDDEDVPADRQYKISAVMFASDFRKVKFKLENGMKLLVRGHVDVYPNRGSYQFYVKQMEIQGVGSLQVAFEQMYKKLKKAGIFDRPKRPINPFPKRVAIVTSNDAAVKHDIITTFRRRNPLIQLVFYPTKVQGDDAAPMIAQQINRASADGDYDTLIVARGGGSRTDLWAFNSEEVGIAIANSTVPVISSVGHEVDTTIADLAADDREATPTSAAVKASAWVLTDVQTDISRLQVQLYHLTKAKLDQLRQRLGDLTNNYVFKEPQRIYDQYLQRVDDLQHQLIQSERLLINGLIQRLGTLVSKLSSTSPRQKIAYYRDQVNGYQQLLITNGKQRLISTNKDVQTLKKQLAALDPNNVLQRGYSYVTSNGQVVKSTKQIETGETVLIHLSDGTVIAEIKKVNTKEE